jgi:NADH-quinone oxidoreductase subunit C
MFEVSTEILNKLQLKLNSEFATELVSYELLYDVPTFVFKKEKLVEILQFLYDDEELQFRFLTTLCGIHYPEATEQLGIIYHLHSFKHNLRIRIKFFTAIENPVFPTITKLFSTANWMERETYDFFGIIFEGHPNLKRILNEEDMTVFPLRKDFPLEDQTREDKIDKFFGR